MLGENVAVQSCAQCGGSVERRFRYCPWCASPLRSKLVEFFPAHPRDAGKALRVSRYLDEDPHVRFSVWDETGRVEGAVSVDELEARGELVRAREDPVVERPPRLLGAHTSPWARPVVPERGEPVKHRPRCLHRAGPDVRPGVAPAPPSARDRRVARLRGGCLCAP